MNETVADLQPQRGELIEIRVPFLYGSDEDRDLKRKLAHSNQLIDLIGENSGQLVMLGSVFSLLRRHLKHEENKQWNELSVVARQAIKMLLYSRSEKVVMFSTVGLGQYGLELMVGVVRFMRCSGARLLLINYTGEDHYMFEPATVKTIGQSWPGC